MRSIRDKFEEILFRQEGVFLRQSIARFFHFVDHRLAGNEMAFWKTELAGTVIVIKVDDRGVQELMKEISKDDLPFALRGANPEVKEKFFKNMSSRAADMLKDDMEAKGPVKVSDIEKAQQNILKVCRKLEEEGRIVIAGAGEEML